MTLHHSNSDMETRVKNMLTVKTSSSPSSPSFWSAVEEVVEPAEEKRGMHDASIKVTVEHTH